MHVLSCLGILSLLSIYIDFARVFDSVVHFKLIFKRSTFGIFENLLNWIAVILNNRFQFVVVEHCNSQWLPVLSGIPQGTVLGPVLFILFIEDIGVICSGSVTHKLFADDMKHSILTLIVFRYNLRLIVYTNGAAIAIFCKCWQMPCIIQN